VKLVGWAMMGWDWSGLRRGRVTRNAELDWESCDRAVLFGLRLLCRLGEVLVNFVCVPVVFCELVIRDT
jgi:hypothetical protein